MTSPRPQLSAQARRALARAIPIDVRKARRARAVRVFADTIADQMRAIHGGTWWVQIDHDANFVIIRQASESMEGGHA